MMKINFKHICLSALSLLALASCSDVVDYSVPNETSNHGAPEIQNIYDVKDTGYVKPLVSGELNQMIHIKGSNLANAKKILFNDVAVDVRQIYAKSNEAWIKIPRAIPEEKTNILYYQTDQGEVEYNFEVTIPHVKLEGLKNEFAKPGSQVLLNADYMDLYGFNDNTEESSTKIYIENEEAGYHKDIKCDSCSEALTRIVIPADCPDNSLIHFEWSELDGKHTKTIPYRMTKGLLTNYVNKDCFDKEVMKNAWTDGTNKNDPESVGYPFYRIKGSFDEWSWNDAWGGCNWENLDAALHPENYVFKFDVATSNDYPFISYGDNGHDGSKNGGYILELAGGYYQFDPQYMGITNTEGKWETVTIPLDEMLTDQKGVLHELPKDGSWASFGIVIQPQKAWDVDHSFGQFRIEPKNY